METLLSLNSVTKSYRRGSETITALNRVSLALLPGEFAAVEGPSGAGKTSLLKVAAGYEQADAGQVKFSSQRTGHHYPLSQMRTRARTKLRRQTIGFVFQFFQLLPNLSTLHNVALPLQFCGVRAKHADQAARRLLDDVHLGDKWHLLPCELSGGEMQRAAIARALVTQPELVLADEPTGHLDSETSLEIIALLSRAAKEHGAGVIVATHDAQVAKAADRRMFLVDGRLISRAGLV